MRRLVVVVVGLEKLGERVYEYVGFGQEMRRYHEHYGLG